MEDYTAYKPSKQQIQNKIQTLDKNYVKKRRQEDRKKNYFLHLSLEEEISEDLRVKYYTNLDKFNDLLKEVKKYPAKSKGRLRRRRWKDKYEEVILYMCVHASYIYINI